MASDPEDLKDSTSEALAAIEEAISRLEGRQPSGTLKSELSVESDAARPDGSLTRIAAQFHSFADQSRSVWILFLLLQLALAGGALYHNAIDGISTSWLDESWKAVFGLLGAAALGFGAAALF